MKKFSKVDLCIIVLLVIAISIQVLSYFTEKPKEEFTKASYLTQINQNLSDSILVLKTDLEQAKRSVAQHEIVIENLKIRKNEKINHIDTMSSNDLYLFFTEQ